MRINFVQRENGPERLICEAEVVFEEGVDSEHLAGLKLVGFSLWKAPDGEIYVTFPSRAFGAGSDRKYFDYLRSAEGSPADSKRLKAGIIKAWHSVNDGLHEPTEQERARQHDAGLKDDSPTPRATFEGHEEQPSQLAQAVTRTEYAGKATEEPAFVRAKPVAEAKDEKPERFTFETLGGLVKGHTGPAEKPKRTRKPKAPAQSRLTDDDGSAI